MASLEPRFLRGADGSLVLNDTEAAVIIKKERRKWEPAKPAIVLKKEAVDKVKEAGGDVNDSKHVLGFMPIQFGLIRGMPFKWLVENSPGYAAYISVDVEKDDSKPLDNLWVNKMALKKYLNLWEEGKTLVSLKRKEMGIRPKITVRKGVSPMVQASTPAMSDEDLLSATQELEQKVISGNQTTPGVKVVSSRELLVPTISAQRRALLSGAHLPVHKPSPATATCQKPLPATATCQNQLPATATRQKPLPATATCQKQLPATATCQKPLPATGTCQTLKPVGLSPSLPLPVSDSNLQLQVTQQPVDSQPVGQTPQDHLCLPARWKTTLPKADLQWISKALFRWTKTGGVELVPEHLNKLWWYPPQPAVAVNNIPGVDRYFARPLFLWMPRKQWKVKLHCPNPACERELASAGINQKVRQVMDIDGYYNMACDNLECTKCKKRMLSWSHAILSQLDIGHRVQFPCILTAKHACDVKIVRLLRNRGLGNSCSQIRKKLEEQHGEKWLQNVLHYLTDCSGFSRAADSSLLDSPTFVEPPERPPLPRHRWLMQIYIQDVLYRLDEIKAGITSVFGRILKIDSTKKIVKKLAGPAAKTALWCTNVGNEHGQVLTSVMTTGEGYGLNAMLVGVINRYTKANVSSPDVLYTDRDCCGDSTYKQVLTRSTWNTVLRLDIWHFMRRIATGCTTESHQLYSSFMGLLSNCIFHWDEQDLSRLIKSKRKELAAQHLPIKADAEVMKHLSRYELALHCRRTTRGEAETTELLDKLINAFSGEKGRDTLGVPLLNKTRMDSIWKAAKKHIPCIQDPPGVSLYTRTGFTKKGDIELPNYRCARGSTSLECFHLHLNRFIPGTLASDVLFQACLLDGLHRWNEDRGRAATSTATVHHSYSGLLQHTANVLGLKVLKRKVAQTYSEPRKYTGERIGIEYLYEQTGKVMEDFKKTIEALEETVPDDKIISTAEEDESLQATVQIKDLTVSTVGLNESSEVDLETPIVLPMPQEAEQSDQSSSAQTQAGESCRNTPVTLEAEQPPPSSSSQSETVGPTLTIPGPKDYEAMWDTIDRQTAAQPADPVQSPVIQEESTCQAVTEQTDKDSDSEQPANPVQSPVIQEESACEAVTKQTDKDSDSEEECRDMDGYAGFDKVQELAAYLVSLRGALYFTPAQATHLIQLWDDLYDYDKGPTVFQERFTKEHRGRHKPKKTVRNVVPGVESTQRIMRGGPGAVPATFPYINRITRAIFIQLLAILPKNRTRMDEVTKAYYGIRLLVLSDGKVMSDTRIQLPEISRGTLLQWHTKYGLKLDELVLKQGVRFETPPQTISRGIPAAVDKPAELPTGRTEPHVFPCPTNTAGSAKMKGQRKKSSKSSQVVTSAQPTATVNAPESSSLVAAQSTSRPSVCHSTCTITASQSSSSVAAPLSSATVSSCQNTFNLPAQQSTPAGPVQQPAVPFMATPTAPLQMMSVNIDGQLYQLTQTSQAREMSVPSTAVPSNVPYTTQRYRKRKHEKEQEGIFKRKYDRKKTPTCKKCGQDRIPPTHIQYFMNWFCGVTATTSLEDWKQELSKKGYGRKNKP